IEGAIHVMFMTKLKITLTVLLALGVAGVGAGTLGNWLSAGDAGIPLADAKQGAQAPTPQGPKGSVAPPSAVASQLELQDPMPDAVRRRRSQNNLKMIGLALHNHHDVNNAFPAPAIYSKDGKALLSWRVAILPYLEQDNLYKQFRLDEP